MNASLKEKFVRNADGYFLTLLAFVGDKLGLFKDLAAHGPSTSKGDHLLRYYFLITHVMCPCRYLSTSNNISKFNSGRGCHADPNEREVRTRVAQWHGSGRLRRTIASIFFG